MPRKRQNPYGEPGEELIGCGAEIINCSATIDEEIPFWLYNIKRIKQHEKELDKYIFKNPDEEVIGSGVDIIVMGNKLEGEVPSWLLPRKLKEKDILNRKKLR